MPVAGSPSKALQAAGGRPELQQFFEEMLAKTTMVPAGVADLWRLHRRD